MPKKTPKGFIRIIGGKWRGRKIPVPQVSGLRPTTDRTRETLFNWLMPHINGACCLDMFAGSGALAFEALSRGANKVVMVDKSPSVVSHLQKQIALLQADNAQVLQAQMPKLLSPLQAKFDIVFIDPPFSEELLQSSCQWLEDMQILAEHALIYLEMDKQSSPLQLPDSWHVTRKKQAGQVIYILATVQRQN